MEHGLAHGLVQWREWGEAAFAEARARDVPVLLDIGAVWCHWCHVMDTGIDGDPVHTGTYSHPVIAQQIADGFVPIKVDTDKRPDINARYNMGGWPSTVFLTPDGDTLYGETYVPPARMRDLLEHISQLWREQRTEIVAQTQAMRQQGTVPLPAPSALDTDTVPRVLSAVHDAFDPLFGGFVQAGRFAPKFPHPDALLLAAEGAARQEQAPPAPQVWGEETIDSGSVSQDVQRLVRSIESNLELPPPKLGGPGGLASLLKTLHNMAHGGMYDEYAGGFFRYSTTRDWSIPHYEKMLEDNAKLTHVYAVASELLHEPALLDVVKSAQGWVLSDLRDPNTGAFGGSQDADKEELYYGLPLSERAALPTPFIDRTIYAGWNCLMVSTLVTRWKLTGESDILDAAQKAFAFLQDNFIAAAGIGVIPSQTVISLFHYHKNGEEHEHSGLLVDQSAFTNAALDLYEATGERLYLKDAEASAGYVYGVMQDKDAGGFYDVVPDPNAIGALARPRKDMNENADAALALCRLSALTGDNKYRTAAERALALFTDEYKNAGYFAATYARAADAVLRPSLHIVIVRGSDEDTRELQRAAWFLPYPGLAVETLDAETAKERGFPPSETGHARAYVCVGTACHVADTKEELVRLATTQ